MILPEHSRNPCDSHPLSSPTLETVSIRAFIFMYVFNFDFAPSPCELYAGGGVLPYKSEGGCSSYLLGVKNEVFVPLRVFSFKRPRLYLLWYL